MTTGSSASKSFQGKIELDIRDSEPDWGPYAAPTAPEESASHRTVSLKHGWPDDGRATPFYGR